jgi:hypothetical protein
MRRTRLNRERRPKARLWSKDLRLKTFASRGPNKPSEDCVYMLFILGAKVTVNFGSQLDFKICTERDLLSVNARELLT